MRPSLKLDLGEPDRRREKTNQFKKEEISHVSKSHLLFGYSKEARGAA
jgi:hypothetical protein